MPTAPGFANVSLELKHSLLSRKAYVTFGVDPTSTDPATVGSQVHGAVVMSGSLNSIIDSNVTLTAVHVSLGTDGAEDLVGVYTSSTVGGKSTTSSPPNVALLVHKYTARGGRRGRGRMFLPWVVVATNTPESGSVDPSDRTAAQTAMNTFLAGLTTGLVPMVVLHRPSETWDPIKETGVEHPTTPGPPNVVTSLVVDPLVATQRRRLGR